MSNEVTSGNRGVILHMYGSGRLIHQLNVMSLPKRRIKKDRDLQHHSCIDRRVRIDRHLLPVFIMRVFQSNSPQHSGYIDE